MKKDFFNNNIKPEYVSYIWTTIIIICVVSLVVAACFIYGYFEAWDEATRGPLLWLGIISLLFGAVYSLGTICVIRSYPKSKKIITWFLNSDYYFVGRDSKKYYGHWRGKHAFAATTSGSYVSRNMIVGSQYAQQYRIYVRRTIMNVILMFANIAAFGLVFSNFEKLPVWLQSEWAIGIFFALLEVLFMVLGSVCAFRVKDIREKMRKEYLRKKISEEDEW